MVESRLEMQALRCRPKESWRGADLGERLRFLRKEMFILHPSLVAVLCEIKQRYRMAKESGSAMALLVIVASGGGKSHLIRLLHRLMPDRDSPTQVIRSFASFSIPQRPTPMAMTRALRQAIGDPGWKSSDEEALDCAVDIMKRLGIRVIAIDNVQDIPERRGAKGIQLLGNWIRDLWDKADCLIVLLGTPAALEIVKANPQLRRRNPGRLSIPYFSTEDHVQAARFKRFLKEVDNTLPLAESCGLELHAQELYWATFGNPDYIFQLLAQAISVAITDARESVGLADLAEAFERHYLESGAGLNPFVEGGPKRPLDLKGEPFDEWPRVEARGISKQVPSHPQSPVDKGGPR